MSSIYNKQELETCAVQPRMSFPQELDALADTFELLSFAFAFPTESLAQALVEGSFQADLNDCLAELGISEQFSLEDSANAQELFESMRQEYSRLYLSPGKLVVIYPYESAFIFKKNNIDGFPTLINSPTTIAVEKAMAQAGALPQTARTEPVDSVWGECEFMRFLLTQALAYNLNEASLENSQDSNDWLVAAQAFFSEHMVQWLPDFMSMTAEHSRSAFYRNLAQAAEAVLLLVRRGEEL